MGVDCGGDDKWSLKQNNSTYAVNPQHWHEEQGIHTYI